MDTLRITSDFMKGIISKVLVKKFGKYMDHVKIENVQIDRQKEGGYKVHLNAYVHINTDICLTDEQVSQLLHSL